MADPRFDAINTAFADYAAKVDAYITAAEAFKAEVTEVIIPEAVAKDDAEEDVDFAALSTAIMTAAEKVPTPPEAPTQ